ncbi:CIC11C00000000976 [Sungouiella intermedia]|uniref:CIC11C00000000976 n=1 Tax=Sungouiella intermedia TaxID=45354 RepID=A0A1L0BCY4_9ASCO|nr:CIC11C00000000976 [[Candida] intermedia]
MTDSSRSESPVEKVKVFEMQVVEGNELSVHDYIAETRPWYKVPHLRRLSWVIFLITITSTNNGYDGSMLNGLQSLSHWQSAMDHPVGQKLGALSNGALFGGSPTLISELAFPTHREVSTFVYSICWYLGAVLAAWVTYGTRTIDGNASWKIPSYLQGAFPLIQIFFCWMIPESPRFYVARGKFEKARQVLCKHHIGNSQDPRDIALVEFELKEIESALEQEKLQANTSYLDFVNKKNFRKRGF